MTCCICLEPPTSKYPIYLLACGCAQAWFHIECEQNWLNSTDEHKCPTCRQTVPFQTVYSFAYESGYDQQTLHHVMYLFGIQCIFTNILNPLCTIGILSIPFAIPNPYTLHYYMDIVQWKQCLDMIILLNGYNTYTVNAVCLGIFILQALVLYRKNVYWNPLTHYIIQYDIIHKKMQTPFEEVTLEIPPRNTFLFYLPPNT
jgi:hypothetical protein